MQKPGVVTGGIVGLLLTVPLVVISGLANQLAGLPFIPYDFFPFARDLTPGVLLTFVIDTMVGTLRALNVGRVDTAAKTAEQGMSMLMVVGVGVVSAAIFFAIMRRLNRDDVYLPGLVFGLLVGVPMALIVGGTPSTTATTGSPLINAIWVVALFVGWALLLAWSYQRLSVPEVTLPARATVVRS